MKDAKNFIPGLGKEFAVKKDEISAIFTMADLDILVARTGTGESTSIAASATEDVAITHAGVGLNTLPVVTVTTESCTAVLIPESVTLTGFKVKVTNGTAEAAKVAFSYNRISLSA